LNETPYYAIHDINFNEHSLQRCFSVSERLSDKFCWIWMIIHFSQNYILSLLVMSTAKSWHHTASASPKLIRIV